MKKNAISISLNQRLSIVQVQIRSTQSHEEILDIGLKVHAEKGTYSLLSPLNAEKAELLARTIPEIDRMLELGAEGVRYTE